MLWALLVFALLGVMVYGLVLIRRFVNRDEP